MSYTPIKLTVESSGTVEALAELERIATNIPKEIRIATRLAANKGKSLIAKEVSRQVRVTQRDVKKTVKVKPVGDTGHTVALEHSERIPLRDFKAVQNAIGVKYQITEKTIAPGLFQIKSIGNRVFKRKDQVIGGNGQPLPGTRMKKNAKREALVQCFGPSPWGVLQFNPEYQETVRVAIAEEFKKQLQRRLRLIKLRQSGVI